VQVTESECNRERVELGPLLRELSGFPEMHEQLTSSNKLHNKEDFLVCLENVLHTHQEWVISFQQNILLQKCTFDLVVIQNDVLSETLHCVDRLVGDLLH